MRTLSASWISKANAFREKKMKGSNWKQNKEKTFGIYVELLIKAMKNYSFSKLFL